MELERAICHEDPPAPSTAVMCPPTGGQGAAPATAEELSRKRGRTTRALRRELAGDVDTIVLKALRKEPGRRYATAGELGDDAVGHQLVDSGVHVFHAGIGDDGWGLLEILPSLFQDLTRRDGIEPF